MKKNLKRIICFMSIMVMLFSSNMYFPNTSEAYSVTNEIDFISGLNQLRNTFTINAYSIPSESAFSSKLKVLQGRFKQGEYWNRYNAVGSEGTGKIMCPCGSKTIKLCGIENPNNGCSCTCGIYDAGYGEKYQCKGFAYKMGYECFGIAPENWEEEKNLGTVYAGDIISYSNNLSKWGHTIFVYKVDGDSIFYADCNATGACQVNWNGKTSYSELKKKVIISKMHLSGNTLTGGGTLQSAYTYENISGEYYLKNDNTGKYLTVDGFVDADQTNISVAGYSSEKQKVTITKVSGNDHKIVPAGTSRLVNAWGNNPTSGSNVNLYHFDSSTSNTQLWRFEKVGENMYRIHLAYNENLCLANSGTNVIVQTITEYSHVRWILEPVKHVHNYNTLVDFENSHPHYNRYKCSCGETRTEITETNSYNDCKICKGRIKYNANGGILTSETIAITNIAGINIPRAENSIVVYTRDSGEKTMTDVYGGEWAFDSNGEYIADRGWGDENKLAIPSGGFVISCTSSRTAEIEKNLENAKYAYYDTNEKKVYFYANQEDYKFGTKFLSNGNPYGELPVPIRDGYTFNGWYTNAEGGEKITSVVLFNGATQLYAQWTKIEDNDFEYTIDNDEVKITKYIGNKSDVTIPSIIEGKPVKVIGYGAFRECTSLINVNIPDGVYKIEQEAFYLCGNLTSVKFPNTLTKIEEDAFNECRKLATINIPESVTDIGRFAFAYCSTIENIMIPRNVEKIEEGAFYLAHKLQNINVDSDNQYYTSEDGILFNKDKTALIAFPFGKSEEGKTYVIPSGVRYIGSYALAHSKFEHVEIPNTVTNIEHDAFQRKQHDRN